MTATVNALDQVRIVLIQTFHPGNIGSAARAMKTMGLSQLWLVRPRQFPDADASAMAAGAEDILASAHVVETLEEALADCNLVIGTSARERSFNMPHLLPEQAAEELLTQAAMAPVALVFGRERMGLHNDEIQQCQFQVNIPANPDYPVMNIAAAIQVLCYELFRRSTRTDGADHEFSEDVYPLQKELSYFYQHLEDTLQQIGFLKEKHPGQTMDRLKTIFRKSRLEKKELAILRGILSSVNQAADSDSKL